MSMEQDQVRQTIKEVYTMIQPPEDLKEKLFEKIGQKSRRSRKAAFARRAWVSIGVAVLCLALTVGAAAVSPVVHAAMLNIPIIGSIIASLGDMGQKNAAQHIESRDLTVEDQGIRLSIREVLYDGTQLAIGYETNLKQTDFEVQNLFFDLLIDGQSDMYWPKSSGADLSESGAGTNNILTVIPRTQFPDQFDMNLNITQIGAVKGSWAFKLPVSLTTPAAQTFEPNQEQQFDEFLITVKKITFAPTAMNLDLKISQPNGYVMLDFDVYDDQGNPLFRTGYRVPQAELDVIDWLGTYEPMNRVPEFITIKPRYDKPGVTDHMGSMKIPLTK